MSYLALNPFDDQEFLSLGLLIPLPLIPISVETGRPYPIDILFIPIRRGKRGDISYRWAVLSIRSGILLLILSVETGSPFLIDILLNPK